MFARMGAAAVSAPFMASFADRHEQRRVMLATDLARVGALAAIAASAAAGVPALVYGLAIVTSIISTAFRPAEASLIPRLAETPEELTAANVTSSTFDSVGAFAGPAAGALLYALGGPTLAFLCVSLTYLWSASFVARIPKTERPEPAPHEDEDAGGIAAGFRAVRGEPRLRVVIGLYAAQTMVAGAYSVLVVVVALELLDLGSAGVGFLQAATGVGAIVGAIVALALAGRRRTAANFGLGLACFGAPLLALAALPRTWAAIVALALLGIGNSVVDISAVTLIQRTASAAVAGRIFGLVEAAAVGGLGIGAVLTPLLLHLAGARWTLAVAGAILPVLSLGDARLTREDRRRRDGPGGAARRDLDRAVPRRAANPAEGGARSRARADRAARGRDVVLRRRPGRPPVHPHPGDDRDRPAERAEDARRSRVRRGDRPAARHPAYRDGPRRRRLDILDARRRPLPRRRRWAQPQPEGGRRTRLLAGNRAQRLNKPRLAL